MAHDVVLLCALLLQYMCTVVQAQMGIFLFINNSWVLVVKGLKEFCRLHVCVTAPKSLC